MTAATQEPFLPYDGTSGWSGSDASQARAEYADASGLTSERQIQVVDALALAGNTGGTWKELGAYLGWHHGTISGALSVLHQGNYIARLVEQRNKCSVYVHPDFIFGRATSEPRATQAGLNRQAVAAALRMADKAAADGILIDPHQLRATLEGITNR
jgi:hypothetical protein